MKLRRTVVVALGVLAVALSACGGDSSGGGDATLTIYSGREEEIVAPLFVKFTKKTGIAVDVRYAGSAEMAAQIAEEGSNSPADIFFAQDVGSLGVASAFLEPLPQASLDKVKPELRDPEGRWMGVSGRVRVIAYNTDKYRDGDLPDTIEEYASPQFKGRIGIAPTNGSFQSFVSAMRVKVGDARTKQFLLALKTNDAKTYENNTAIMDAILAREVDIGFVNHYYLSIVKEEQPDAPIANKFMVRGDPGSFVNVAGVGILATSKKQDAAKAFVEYLLSAEGQRFYPDEASENEYPLVAGYPAAAGLPPLSDLQLDQAGLAAVAKEAEATLRLLDEVGLTS